MEYQQYQKIKKQNIVMENNTEIYSLFPTPLLVSSFPPSFSRIIPWLDSQPMEPLELLQENQHGTTSDGILRSCIK